MAEKPDTSTDKKIASRLIDDPDSGLRSLLEEHGGRVRAFLQKRYGGLGHELIEDAMAEALFLVYKRAAEYDPAKASLGTWFLAVANNCMKDILRSQHRHAVQALDTMVELSEREPHPPDTRQKELMSALNRAIESLPERQRTIIMADLAAGEAADTSLLAERLGTTRDSIRVLRTRARKQLMNFLSTRYPSVLKTPGDR